MWDSVVCPGLLREDVVVYPQFVGGKMGSQVGEATWSLQGLKAAVVGCSLSPGSLQMTTPTFGSGAHCSGTSRTAPCPCHSDSSMRRSGADFG